MFTFPLDPEELFEERARQFVGWGIPARTVQAVRAEVRDAWSEQPWGWTPSWERHAQAAETGEDWLLAALCHGAAKFPCLATPARVSAYERQLKCYKRAAAELSLHFDRQVLDVPYGDERTPVTVHVLRRRRRPGATLLVLSGGVDTWKIELHRLASLIAQLTGWIVATIDMPGTGESRIALAPDGDAIFRAAIDELTKSLRARKRGFFGISFGGHWAAKLALTEAVDAAIDLGGPVGATDDALRAANLPGGMTGIVGNALGLDAAPSPSEVARLFDAFSLGKQGLLQRPGGSPLLVVNGADDAYIPLEDTTVFRARPEATVWVVEGATHSAAEHIRRVLPAAIAWLVATLGDRTLPGRLGRAVARLPVRSLLVQA